MEEVCDRFRIEAAHTLSPEKVEEALDILLHIDELDSLADIGKILH